MALQISFLGLHRHLEDLRVMGKLLSGPKNERSIGEHVESCTWFNSSPDIADTVDIIHIVDITDTFAREKAAMHLKTPLPLQ